MWYEPYGMITLKVAHPVVTDGRQNIKQEFVPFVKPHAIEDNNKE